ncbi:MAG: grasp-with-spasm system SPASM domain peptide maturase, partial [Bacteroidota bacterium]
GFYTHDPALFPPLPLEWKSPSQITNAIVCLSPLLDERVFLELEALGCESLEIRSKNPVSKEDLLDILQHTKSSSIANIDLILPYTDRLKKELEEISNKHIRINQIILYSSPLERQYELKHCAVILTPQLITNESCGIISTSYFTSNVTLYTESLQFNSCLNRKIAIDETGEIRNCPSMQKAYGNIQTSSLLSAIQQPDFQTYWHINKDQVKVCQDCEFRYICTDCRAYTEDPEDDYSKPLKCGYDPYTGEWQEWSQHPVKQAAIQHYFGQTQLT